MIADLPDLPSTSKKVRLSQLVKEFNLARPTAQQANAIILISDGVDQKAVAEVCGYAHITALKTDIARPNCLKLLELLGQTELNKIKITRDRLVAMAVQAYEMAATSSEMTAAVKEIGQITGLRAVDNKTTKIEVETKSGSGVSTKEALEKMSTAQLLEVLNDRQAIIDAEVIR